MNYVREFIELNQEQQGYSLLGETVKGTCKFEVLKDKLKVKVAVNNLKKLREGLTYTVHMIKVSDNESISVPIGDLNVDKYGRANLNFQKSLIDGKEVETLKDFDVLAVIIKDEKGFDNLTTPAIGYRKSKKLWRHNFITYDNKKEELKKFQVKVNGTEENIQENKEKQARDNTSTFNGMLIDELEQRDDYEVVKDDDGNPIMVKRFIDIEPKYKKTENLINEDEHDEKNKIEDSNTDNNSSLDMENTENDTSKYDTKESYEKESNTTEAVESNAEDTIETEVYEDNVGKDVEENKNYKDVKLNRFSRKADEMFNTYPKLYPFQKAGKKETWIRIEPRDIAIFPINTWQMMNNPFLVTGYYKHHHLLLGENIRDNGERYYLLAVPSQYNSRQKRVANLHGFEYFRSCRDIQPRTGEFGYWIKEITV